MALKDKNKKAGKGVEVSSDEKVRRIFSRRQHRMVGSLSGATTPALASLPGARVLYVWGGLGQIRVAWPVYIYIYFSNSHVDRVSE